MRHLLSNIALGVYTIFRSLWRAASLAVIAWLGVYFPYAAIDTGNLAYLAGLAAVGVWGFWWWETR